MLFEKITGKLLNANSALAALPNVEEKEKVVKEQTKCQIHAYNGCHTMRALLSAKEKLTDIAQITWSCFISFRN